MTLEVNFKNSKLVRLTGQENTIALKKYVHICLSRVSGFKIGLMKNRKSLLENAVQELIFRKNYSGAYKKALMESWLDEICDHMVVKNNSVGFWTEDKIFEDVNKHTTLKNFREQSRAAYDAAYRQGLMDEVKKRLTVRKKANGYWSFERVHTKAKIYKTRMLFQKGAPGAYSRAHKNGWLDEVCKYMIT